MNQTNGNYTLDHMIAGGINLNYRYEVDTSHPGFVFTIKHQANGADLKTPIVANKRPNHYYG